MYNICCRSAGEVAVERMVLRDERGSGERGAGGQRNSLGLNIPF